MSVIALGFALVCFAGAQYVYGGAWTFITLGWFGISMWLWRKNILLDRATYTPPPRRRR